MVGVGVRIFSAKMSCFQLEDHFDSISYIGLQGVGL